MTQPYNWNHYAARPYAAHVQTSHFSGSFRFFTEAAAIDYILQQAALVRDEIATRANGAAWTAFDCFRSYVEYPDGRKIAARFILFVDDIASH